MLSTWCRRNEAQLGFSTLRRDTGRTVLSDRLGLYAFLSDSKCGQQAGSDILFVVLCTLSESLRARDGEVPVLYGDIAPGGRVRIFVCFRLKYARYDRFRCAFCIHDVLVL